MDVQLKAKNVRLTEGLEEYIRRRLQKLDRLNEPIVDAKFEIRSEKNRTGGEQIVAQFTIATRRAILRAEEKNHDVHAAIDLAVDRMTRQIKRFRDKKIVARRRIRPDEQAAMPAGAILAEGLDGSEPDVEDDIPVEALVRRKRFKVQPMGEAEAIEQMELLGHDFYVFYNPDEAQINVLYRRRDGRYGLIQPELA